MVPLTVTVGVVFTVTLYVAVLVQLLALVPVTVYVRVAVGLATAGFIFDAVVKPEVGDHTYVLAPAAVSVVLCP